MIDNLCRAGKRERHRQGRTREDVLHSRIAWALGALLGEGPLWLPEDRALWFVDIKRGALNRFDPVINEGSSFAVGGRPSFIVPADDGSLLVGDGDAVRPFRSGVLGDPIARIEMPAHNRTNDATVDPRGRLWFGTMDDQEARPTGAVHIFDGHAVRAVGGECTITNGPAISPDGRRLYHVDTLGGTIWRFHIGDTDSLADGERFVSIEPEDGTPDGVTIDSEGCLWVAVWGGGEVRRYAPDGALLARVALPCANVTKVAFGGPDLLTAFVTTAAIGLSDGEQVAQPLAGGLFAFDAPAPGLPPHAVKLSA